MKRHDVNVQILKRLKTLVDTFPDQRFGQLIVNYVFPSLYDRDIFFDESNETLEVLDKWMKDNGLIKSE